MTTNRTSLLAAAGIAVLTTFLLWGYTHPRNAMPAVWHPNGMVPAQQVGAVRTEPGPGPIAGHSGWSR